MENEQDSLRAGVQAIVDANLYLVLGTADAAGRPWVSPVYFAPVGYTEFLWVSRPGARHSLNLAARPEVSIVIYDSTQPINTGQGVYVAARAEEVQADVDRLVTHFSRSVEARGAAPWTPADVLPPARHRLYKATATEIWTLNRHDERIPVPL